PGREWRRLATIVSASAGPCLPRTGRFVLATACSSGHCVRQIDVPCGVRRLPPRANERLVHVVDDEDSIRRSLDFLLHTAGFRVEKWEDGETFLKGADRALAACVLLDVRMPGMDGLRVQAEMAARGFNFPIIVLTGHGDVGI